MDLQKTERFVKSIESAVEDAEPGEWKNIVFHHVFDEPPKEDLLIHLADEDIQIKNISKMGFDFKLEEPSRWEKIPTKRLADLIFYVIYQEGYELATELGGSISFSTEPE